MKMSWITEKELVIAGQRKIRPCVTVHAYVFTHTNPGEELTHF